MTYGELAPRRPARRPRRSRSSSRTPASFKVIGTAQNRIDARAAVTGRKEFTIDLRRPRRPADDGVPRAHAQRHARGGSGTAREVLAMPGVTDVAIGRHRRRGARPARSASASTPSARCEVAWAAARSRASPTTTVLGRLKAAEVPLPALPDNPLAETVEAEFTFYFRSNSALEPNSAIADVRADRAEIWAGLQVADRRPGGDRRGSSGLPHDAVRSTSIAGRWLVRPQAVLRRRARGGEGLARRSASR